jgi:hypothetical protein
MTKTAVWIVIAVGAGLAIYANSKIPHGEYVSTDEIERYRTLGTVGGWIAIGGGAFLIWKAFN